MEKKEWGGLETPKRQRIIKYIIKRVSAYGIYLNNYLRYIRKIKITQTKKHKSRPFDLRDFLCWKIFTINRWE